MALHYRSFGFQVLVGMVAGLALGLVARTIGAGPDGDLNWLATALKTVGSIFVSLLKAIVPPLVFAAIVASIANLRALDNAARLAGQTLLWFGITALIAIHDLNHAGRFCDQIVMLDQGTIIKSGTPAEALQEDTLKQVYGLRVTIEEREGFVEVRPVVEDDLEYRI